MYALKYIFINVTFNSIFWYHDIFSYHIQAFMISRNGNILTEDSEIVKRWKEYCKQLYNYTINLDKNILNDYRGAS